MSIQRYDGPGEYGPEVCNAEDLAMVACDDGQYVLYTAHDAEVERLTAENKKYVDDLVNRGTTMINVLTVERDAAVRERDAAVEALNHACKHLCQWKDACETGCIVSAALAKIEGGRG